MVCLSPEDPGEDAPDECRHEHQRSNTDEDSEGEGQDREASLPVDGESHRSEQAPGDQGQSGNVFQ